MEQFYQLSGVDSTDLFRLVTRSNALKIKGALAMARAAGSVLNSLTKQQMQAWLRVRGPGRHSNSAVMEFCREHALPPCILRSHFYKNGDLNKRGWGVLGISRKCYSGQIADRLRQPVPKEYATLLNLTEPMDLRMNK